MADRAGGKTAWVLALAGAGAAAGALLRYPQLEAASGVQFLALFAIALVVLGLPLLMGEAAIGQYRRRNVVDAFGTGAWRAAGLGQAVAALLLAALLAVLGGWAARYLLQSFNGDYFADPARAFRLLSGGFGAVLATLAVLAAATLLALRGMRASIRGAVSTMSGIAFLLLVGLGLWAFFQSGAGAGRLQALSFHAGRVTGRLAVAAALQALLPVLTGFGLVVTLSPGVEHRRLPGKAITLLLLLVSVPLFVGLLVTTTAAAHGIPLAGGRAPTDAFEAIPALFAAVGGTLGGVLSGLFFTAVLLCCLTAIVGLVEVLATWLTELDEPWGKGQGVLGAGLAAYLLALPFCFGAARAWHLSSFLAGVAAPLGALAVALHVGWRHPEMLDGFMVGEKEREFTAFLRPLLRFVAPPACAILLVLGSMMFLRDVGALHGSSGLWSVVP